MTTSLNFLSLVDKKISTICSLLKTGPRFLFHRSSQQDAYVTQEE